MARRRSTTKVEEQCKTCINAVYDPVWGEHKCTSLQNVIYKPDDVSGCIYYKKGEPAISKKFTEDVTE